MQGFVSGRRFYKGDPIAKAENNSNQGVLTSRPTGPIRSPQYGGLSGPEDPIEMSQTKRDGLTSAPRAYNFSLITLKSLRDAETFDRDISDIAGLAKEIEQDFSLPNVNL